MVDFDQILARVTIRDILVDAGHLPVRNRMPCPLHDGSNKTSFSFTDSTFICHACSAKGGLLDLVEHLYHCNRQEALRHLCRMTGVVYGEAAEQSLATFRRDSDPPDVSENILQVRQALQDAKELVKRLPEPEPDEPWEAKNRLEWLRLYKDALDANLRIIRHNVKQGKMPLEKFYPKEEVLLYQLEEMDTETSHATYEVNNRLKKKVDQNESSRTHCQG